MAKNFSARLKPGLAAIGASSAAVTGCARGGIVIFWPCSSSASWP
jgi:hypothetical protein